MTFSFFLDSTSPPSSLGFWLAAGLIAACKAALVLIGAALAVVVFRRASAATRHLIWSVGLAGALVLPLLSVLLPRWSWSVLAESEPTPIVHAGADVTPEPLEHRGRANNPAMRESGELSALSSNPQSLEATENRRSLEAQAQAPAKSSMSVAAWLIALWCAGAALVLSPLALGTMRVCRLACRRPRLESEAWSQLANHLAVQLGLTRRVVLYQGGRGAMPIAWGVLRPAVLLPEEANEWPDERKRMVLMHELAHIKRGDCLTQWLSRLTCAVYWFNPLAWAAASRLCVERERACDDLVLETGERPSNYATQLLEVARSLRSISFSPALPLARASGLEGRLSSILDSHRSRRRPARKLAILSLSVMLAIAALLAAVRLEARSEPSQAISGVVIGSDGKPAAGVDVVLLLRSERNYTRESVPAETIGRARSDTEGRFQINADANAKSNNGFLLVATAPGSGFASKELISLAEPIEPIRLKAERPVLIKLVDLEGTPLAGAEVRLGSAYSSNNRESLDSEVISPESLPAMAAGWTTDAEGRFRLTGIGEGYAVFLQVRAPGFGNQQVRFEVKPDVPAVTLSLARAHVVEGRVTLGEEGPPAVGATVRSMSLSEKGGFGEVMGIDETKTDSDGRYRIEAAPAGGIRVEVYPPRDGGKANAFLLRGKLVDPGAEVASRLDFALPQGVLVRGRITDAATGQPIVGAIVTHQAHEANNPYFIKGQGNWFNGDEQKAMTKDDGSYQLAVMPGPGYLLVKGPTPNYLHQEISSVELRGQLIWPNTRNYPDAWKKLNPKPDESPIDVDLTLRQGVIVRGRVVGPDGKPALGAVLFSRWHLPKSQMTINYSQSVLATRGDQFELGGCDPHSSAPVFFLDAKRQWGAVAKLLGKQAGEELTIKLEPCGSASVRFVDEQGKPLQAGLSVAHLEVVLTPGASFADNFLGFANEERKSPLMADAISGANLDHRYFNLQTDQDGRITYPTLIPGATYRIGVHNQPVKTQIEFTVKPGESKNLGDLTIRNIDLAG